MENFNKIDLIKWSEGRFIGVDYESQSIHLIYEASSTGLFIKSSYNFNDIDKIKISHGQQFWLLNLLLNLAESFSMLSGSPILCLIMKNGKEFKIDLEGIKTNDYKNLKTEIERLNKQIKKPSF